MKYLYGQEDAEHLYDSPDTVVENYMADVDPEFRKPLVIVQHTVRPPIEHLPVVEWLLEQACDWVSDNAEIDADFDEQIRDVANDPAVVDAFAAALRLWASKLTYRMADEEVGRIKVTFLPDDSYDLDLSEAQ